jgi:hypothetical protein
VQLLKYFSTFYETRRFITVFNCVHFWFVTLSNINSCGQSSVILYLFYIYPYMFRSNMIIIRGCCIHHYRVHKTVSYPEPDQSSPYHPIISIKSILILSTYLRLGIPSDLFPSRFPTNILYGFLFSLIRAIFPTHLILLQLIILFGEEYKL